MTLKHTDFQVPAFGELGHAPLAAPGYADALLVLSPTAYWSLGEAAGTTAADSAGGHALALTDDFTLARPAAAPSADDGAMRFGDGRGRSAGAVLPTTAGAPFSLVFWLRRFTPGAAGAFLGQYLGGVSGRLSVILIADGRLLLSVEGDSSFVSTAAPVDSWTHLALTRDAAGNAAWYLNGQPDTTTTGQSAAVADLPFGLGRQTSTAVEVELDEVAVYPAALTAAQVVWLYRVATDQPTPGVGVH